MKLQPQTDLYQQWVNPPVEIFLNFYLFDLKNPGEFLAGKRPRFEQIGPFVYREHLVKQQIVDNLNGTISYDEIRRFEFRPDLSVHSESFELTTINMAPITILSLIKYLPGVAHTALNIALDLTNDTLIIRKSVQELLFGYEDRLLEALKNLADSIFKDLIPSIEIGYFTGVKTSLSETDFCDFFQQNA
jgi:scavenger receptor class B protein 1